MLNDPNISSKVKDAIKRQGFSDGKDLNFMNQVSKAHDRDYTLATN
jgi:hypothetical protein